MFLLRQISAACVEGEKESLADGVAFPYVLTDVLPKYVLQIGEGAYGMNYIGLEDGDSYTVPLPEDYTNTEILSCVIRANSICRVQIVSPDHGTSTFLIKGTNGVTEGDHFGLLMWQGTVTSITIDVPSGAEDALVGYFLFKLPDLSDASSWRLGDRALGVAT